MRTRNKAYLQCQKKWSILDERHKCKQSKTCSGRYVMKFEEDLVLGRATLDVDITSILYCLPNNCWTIIDNSNQAISWPLSISRSMLSTQSWRPDWKFSQWKRDYLADCFTAHKIICASHDTIVISCDHSHLEGFGFEDSTVHPFQVQLNIVSCRFHVEAFHPGHEEEVQLHPSQSLSGTRATPWNRPRQGWVNPKHENSCIKTRRYVS